MTGLTESAAVITIDKHGNESKVYKVEGGRLKVEGEFNQPFSLQSKNLQPIKRAEG